MKFVEILKFLAVWGVIGAAAFSLFVVIVFRSRIVFSAREADGSLKEQIPLGGRLAMIGFLALVLGFFLAADRIGLNEFLFQMGFGELLFLNFALYTLLFAYDTVVIDALVLGRWRPDFLNLPEEMGAVSMGVHISRSLPVGFVAGVLLSLITSAVSFLIWVR